MKIVFNNGFELPMPANEKGIMETALACAKEANRECRVTSHAGVVLVTVQRTAGGGWVANLTEAAQRGAR